MPLSLEGRGRVCETLFGRTAVAAERERPRGLPKDYPEVRAAREGLTRSFPFPIGKLSTNFSKAAGVKRSQESTGYHGVKMVLAGRG